MMNKIPKNPVADEEMLKNAVGEEEYHALQEPPELSADNDHVMWPKVKAAIKEIYDPEIPVNIYELGLIYVVQITDRADSRVDVIVKMTLTSPGCPVAQDMPGWVQSAIMDLGDGVIGDVDVEIIWEPTWSPAMMAETAKMQLNMFM